MRVRPQLPGRRDRKALYIKKKAMDFMLKDHRSSENRRRLGHRKLFMSSIPYQSVSKETLAKRFTLIHIQIPAYFRRFIAQHGVTTFANLHRPDRNHSHRNLQNQYHFYQQLHETL